MAYGEGLLAGPSRPIEVSWTIRLRPAGIMKMTREDVKKLMGSLMCSIEWNNLNRSCKSHN
jgi:hypothetical protein